VSQKNFVAKHGLTVGNTTIDATTDVANLINVYANGNVTLGNIANVHILGGAANQVIQTDGSGNLIWINSTLDGVMTNTIDPFTGDGNTSNFTLSVTPVSTAFTTVVIDGATQLKSAYSLTGNVLTLSSAPANGVSMEVTTVNGANALAPTLNSIINGNSSVTVALDGDITATTTGNVILGNSVTANYFTGRLYGTANTAVVANTVAGANVTGTVANATYALSSNTANSATVAASANGVAGANVTGAVANATHANTASIAYAVNGSDVVGRVANATYANTAGTVATIAGANVTGAVANATFAETANAVTANAQANITSLGILSTLTTTGNVTIGGNLTVNGSATVSNAVYANSANFATYSTTANVANLAYSVSAANITGNIAYAIDSNTANIANVANTAYSVSGANVSGWVANANIANLAYSVEWANIANIGTIANANHSEYSNVANTAATVTTNAQPNITSTGTLTSLAVSGNVTIAGIVTASGNVANTGFLVGNGAVSNVALGFMPTAGTAAEMAIRDYSTVTSTMYFDVGMGANGTAHQFKFRGSNAYNEWAIVNQYGINLPTRPAFRVTGSGQTVITTTTNTNGVLNSNNWTVDYSQGTGFDSSTGVFTAPIAGLYSAHLVARINNSSTAQIAVVKNYAGTSSVIAMWECGANATVNHYGVSSIAKLAAGDTLVIRVLLGTVTFDGNDNWAVAYIG
jgi:hypothetical protein